MKNQGEREGQTAKDRKGDRESERKRQNGERTRERMRERGRENRRAREFNIKRDIKNYTEKEMKEFQRVSHFNDTTASCFYTGVQ